MESVLTELAAMSLMKVLIWSAPAVLAGLLVGFLISLFQAVTQIQEQTLTFVPKIIAVFVVLLITGPWLINEVQAFTQDTYQTVDKLVRS
jgi:flagellar biosynthetic protein FliQ